ncbi:flagellar biosynthesis regulatory protein FlaF [Terrihabitans soli]|uniref:Flagellar biosynthesis regulatory protein FlaF n=1 Tax=Terrihabitans soli TaxID=708113 RepID=A0A6S6QRE8_9HYPH|nr:flagellar biosynthesis regulator FlaF [Terrihabitans soli]BCJ91629.1 flagellar biosynthesis regulatory protein FlaF [Terrihabitans soli]
MHSGAQAYAKTAKTTAGPRDLEASLLIQAANKLQAVVSGTVTDTAEMRDALRYNRKLWTILATSATAAENPLPPQIKQNIGNIAMFVLPQCVELEANPVPQRMGSLVNINRELAAGLMQKAPGTV